MIYDAKTIDDLYKNNVVKLVREKKYEPCDMIYDDICMCERHFFTVPNQTFLNEAFTTLQYCNNIKELYLWDLGLKDDTLITFPPLLESLDISINKLTKLPTIPESVIILVCSKNRLINIDLPVNSKVQRLFCSNNRITSLNNLSSNIWELKCSDNDITFNRNWGLASFYFFSAARLGVLNTVSIQFYCFV
jgi:Leucine-rich repeat (LRR) protein